MNKENSKKGSTKLEKPFADGNKKTKLVPLVKKEKYKPTRFIDDEDDDASESFFTDDDYDDDDDSDDQIGSVPSKT